MVRISTLILSFSALATADISNECGTACRGQVVEERAGHCFYYIPDKPDSLDVCYNYCYPSGIDKAKQGSMYSVTCLGDPKAPLLPAPPASTFKQYQDGNCLCNNSFINELATDFVEALPSIAAVGCELLFSAFNAVASIGIQAIPGLDVIMDAGMVSGVVGAKVAAQAFDDGLQGATALADWLNPCGDVQDILKNDTTLTTVFGVLNGVDPARLPKGAGVPKVGKQPPLKAEPGRPNQNPAPPKPPKANDSPAEDAPKPSKVDDDSADQKKMSDLTKASKPPRTSVTSASTIAPNTAPSLASSVDASSVTKEQLTSDTVTPSSTLAFTSTSETTAASLTSKDISSTTTGQLSSETPATSTILASAAMSVISQDTATLGPSTEIDQSTPTDTATSVTTTMRAMYSAGSESLSYEQDSSTTTCTD